MVRETGLEPNGRRKYGSKMYNLTQNRYQKTQFHVIPYTPV